MMYFQFNSFWTPNKQMDTKGAFSQLLQYNFAVKA